MKTVNSQMSIYHQQQGEYVRAEASLALPILTSGVLSEFLSRLRDEGESQTILAIDEWLSQQQQ